MSITFPCIEVEQPIGGFLIGAISAQDLVAISFADIRRPEGRDIEKYIGTQRDLNEGRVSEIKRYVKNVDACFPTSIILSIDSEHASYDREKKLLTVAREENVAKIIDGQHRIAGLEGFLAEDTFQLNVTIFIDMDIEDQAMVFATINQKQTPVSKSLAYDLYEYAKSRSPQRTCHNIAKLMHSKEGSPLAGRIKILGKATERKTEIITQATFVDRIMKLITDDPMSDKDLLKRGKSILEIAGSRGEKLVFRELFRDEKDAEIAKILWNYLKGINERWPEGWNNFDRGYVLAKTTGFAALVRLLPLIWLDMGRPKEIPSVDAFMEYLNRSKLNDDDFTSENFKPGSSGESALLASFKQDIFDN